MGQIKRKLGLKGETKPGEMIARMNALKNSSLKSEVATPKVEETIKKII